MEPSSCVGNVPVLRTARIALELILLDTADRIGAKVRNLVRFVSEQELLQTEETCIAKRVSKQMQVDSWQVSLGLSIVQCLPKH